MVVVQLHTFISTPVTVVVSVEQPVLCYAKQLSHSILHCFLYSKAELRKLPFHSLCFYNGTYMVDEMVLNTTTRDILLLKRDGYTIRLEIVVGGDCTCIGLCRHNMICSNFRVIGHRAIEPLSTHGSLIDYRPFVLMVNICV